jgi:uncharacterized surface protein with fasciclin (FAS1) repeats
MKKTLFAMTPLFTLIFALTAQAQQKTIVETAVAAGNFNTLVAAVKAAGLVDTLNGHTPFTVFAPTDDAFAKLDPAMIENLLKPESKQSLTNVLTYHVVAGRVSARDAYDLNSAATVNGQRLPINLRGDVPKVGDSTLVVTDIQCSNGVIHVIDSVLLPKLDSIPATAQAAGKFNTLVAAVGAAGLGEVLSGKGPFTVFAPTDEAFAALPAGTVESLLKPENKQKLIDILKYHVVSGRVYDNDAVKAGSAPSLLGRTLDIKFSAAGIRVNEAKVVAKNIDCSNGVIHVIDSVLIPGSMTPNSVMSTLTSAISSGVPVFNGGDHGKCAEIYMQTLESINSAGIEGADPHTMSMISQTMENARNTNDMSARAWVLRRGMDALYTRMSSMPVTPMSTQTRQ